MNPSDASLHRRVLDRLLLEMVRDPRPGPTYADLQSMCLLAVISASNGSLFANGCTRRMSQQVAERVVTAYAAAGYLVVDGCYDMAALRTLVGQMRGQAGDE